VAASARAHQIYQQTAVQSADPKELIIMLFEAAVRFLRHAAEAMAQRQYEQQCQFITRAQKILTELTCALDEEVDEEFSGNLRLLYTWLHAQLTEASIEDNGEKLSQVIAIVKDLRDAWTEAERRCRKQVA